MLDNPALGDMAGSDITVPTQKSPSLWNDYLFMGAKLGALPAAIALGFASITLPILATIAACGVIGGAVGGAFYGKSEMEKESILGKTYSPPTLFNKSALDGGITAGIASVAILALTVATAGVSGFLFPLLAGMAIATTAGVAYMQGKSGMDTMAKQYEAAKIVTKGPESEGLLSKVSNLIPSVPTISKQESAELDAKLKQGPSTQSAVETLMNQRASAQLAPTEAAR